MTWRPAKSIAQMLEEANDLAPHRSKASDGIIGDASHSARKSDHNPDAHGVVHAIDLTQDPKGGWDCAVRTEELRMSKDPRILYVIFNHRWFHGTSGGRYGHTPWAWEPYHGISPHEEHMHVSVEYAVALADSTAPWWGEEDEVTDADLKKIGDLIDAKLKAYVGAPYRDSSGQVLTANQVLTEKVGESYVDGVKQIRKEIAALDVPRKA